MQDSKLIALLKQLDRRAQGRFADFIASPYFNKHSQVAALGQLLLAQAPNFDHPRKMQKEYIFKRLYPNKAYDDNFLASLISKLQQLLYKFLSLELEEDQELKQEILQLKALRLYKLPKHFKSTYKRCQKLIEKSRLSTATMARIKADFYFEEDRWFLEQGGRSYHPALQKYSDQLDLAYFVQKLQLACDMLNRNIVIEANYQPKMLEEVEQKLNEEKELIQEYPVLRMYRLILQILREEDAETAYQALRSDIQLHSQHLHQEEQRQLYDYALNYCVKCINEGDSSYYEEVLYLYRLLLARELIFIDGFLPAWEYKNIVTAALRTGRFAWVESFIEDYKERLRPVIRENAYLYNLASYFYAAGRQLQALQVLQNVEFTDRTYHLGAKIIQLKSYYELQEWEALEALLDAFKAYLSRQKGLSSYRKKANKGLVDCTRQLMRLTMQKDWLSSTKYREKYQQVKLKISKYQPLASKEWLDEQLEQLHND